MDNKERILIVDDDKIICEHLRSGLSDESYSLVAVNRAMDAIEAVKKDRFNLVLMDLVLPDIQGSALMKTLSNYCPETCFIVFTGFATVSSAIEALKIGAYDYIIKPFDIDHLKLVIRRGLEKQRLMSRNQELIERLEKEKVKLEIIMDAYNRIGSIFSLDELADFVTAKALQIAEAEKSSLMVMDEKANELALVAAQGMDDKLKSLRVKVGDMVSGWVAKEGQVLLVKDIDSDPRLQVFGHKGSYKTKSFISLPLKTDFQVVGVMNVTDKLASTRVFTEEDLKYLQLLAHQTVIQIENIRLCEKLSSMAITDALTGLYNHRFFHEQLSNEIQRARRYASHLSLLMFDIDSFKSYNDRYGHLEGDRVLKQIADVTRRCTRKVDMVCRYGGDEFAVILPSTTLKGAKFVAEKIREWVDKLDVVIKDKNKVIRVSISGGVAGYSEGMSKEELISAADKLLYMAKTDGGDKICYPASDQKG
ncbi:MAG: diguanylate cyclase [Deltaproteobacteria bacterium]